MSSDKNMCRWFRSSISSQLAYLRKAKKNGLVSFTVTSDPEGNFIFIGAPSTRSDLQTLLEPIEEALKRRRRRTQASPTLDEDNEDIIVSTSLQKPTVPVSSVTNEKARRLLPRWLRALTPDGKMGYGKASHRPSFWPADVPWVGKINNLSTAHLREAKAAVVIHVGEDPESFHVGDTRDRHAGGTRDRHAGGTRDRHAGGTRDRHAGGTRDRHAGGTSILNPWSRSTPVLEESFSLIDSSSNSSLASSPPSNSPHTSPHLTTLRPVESFYRIMLLRAEFGLFDLESPRVLLHLARLKDKYLRRPATTHTRPSANSSKPATLYNKVHPLASLPAITPCYKFNNGTCTEEDDHVSSTSITLHHKCKYCAKYRPDVTLDHPATSCKYANKQERDAYVQAKATRALEYAAPVWDPLKRQHSQTNSLQIKLEAVPRRAARWVHNDYRHTTIATKLVHNLGWPTLQDDCTEIEAAEEADHEDDDPIDRESSCTTASAAASGGGTLACDVCGKVYKISRRVEVEEAAEHPPWLLTFGNLTTPGNTAARTVLEVLGTLGHRLQDFTNDVTCSICGGQGHVHRACPKSFANVITPGGNGHLPVSKLRSRSREREKALKKSTSRCHESAVQSLLVDKEHQAELTQLKAKLAEKEKELDDCQVNVMVVERVALLRNALSLQPHLLKLPKLLPTELANPERTYHHRRGSHFNPRRNGDTRVCDCGREIVRRDVDRLAGMILTRRLVCEVMACARERELSSGMLDIIFPAVRQVGTPYINPRNMKKQQLVDELEKSGYRVCESDTDWSEDDSGTGVVHVAAHPGDISQYSACLRKAKRTVGAKPFRTGYLRQRNFFSKRGHEYQWSRWRNAHEKPRHTELSASRLRHPLARKSRGLDLPRFPIRRPTVPSRWPTKAPLPIHIKNTSTSQQMAEMSGTRRPCTTEQVHDALIADKTRAWNSEQMLNADLSFYPGSLWSEASDTEAPTVRDLRDQPSLTNRVDKQLEEIFGSTSKSNKRPTYRRETDTSSSPPCRSPLPAVSRKPSSVRRVRHVSSTDRSFSPPPHLSSSRRHVSPGNIDKTTLPVQYYNSKTVWVTSYIFEDWVRKFDRKLGRDHRKAILFTTTPSGTSCATSKRSALTRLFTHENTPGPIQSGEGDNAGQTQENPGLPVRERVLYGEHNKQRYRQRSLADDADQGETSLRRRSGESSRDTARRVRTPSQAVTVPDLGPRPAATAFPVGRKAEPGQVAACTA
ncbi:hypothetical protein Bbelb_018680 [Branchiostoma belcheri]|nr:hypothetical protein Bbelb_018680 [Branchiostoma belcheri]